MSLGAPNTSIGTKILAIFITLSIESSFYVKVKHSSKMELQTGTLLYKVRIRCFGDERILEEAECLTGVGMAGSTCTHFFICPKFSIVNAGLDLNRKMDQIYNGTGIAVSPRTHFFSHFRKTCYCECVSLE